MAKYSLKAQERSVVGKKVRQLRRQGFVPGTVYGPHIDPLTLQFDYRELEGTLKNAGGTNLIDIQVQDGDTYPVLAREVQRDILRGDIKHVDFFAVDMKQTLRAEVPVIFEGVSPLVQSRKGIMITGPNSLTMEMLPTKIMDRVTIDVSKLDHMGATIMVKDLELDEGIEILNDQEEMLAKIVQVAAARASEAAAAVLDAEGEPIPEGEGEEEPAEEPAE